MHWKSNLTIRTGLGRSISRLTFLALTFKLFPAFFSNTLASFGTPLNATGNLFPVNIISAFAAPDAVFIWKYFNIILAIGAFIYIYFKVPAILPRTITYHCIHLQIMPRELYLYHIASVSCWLWYKSGYTHLSWYQNGLAPPIL